MTVRASCTPLSLIFHSQTTCINEGTSSVLVPTATPRATPVDEELKFCPGTQCTADTELAAPHSEPSKACWAKEGNWEREEGNIPILPKAMPNRRSTRARSSGKPHSHRQGKMDAVPRVGGVRGKKEQDKHQHSPQPAHRK